MFRLDLNGALSVVYDFAGPDGSTPWSGVTQWTAGALYGVTVAGGAFNRGELYRLHNQDTATLTSLTLSQSVVSADRLRHRPPLESRVRRRRTGSSHSARAQRHSSSGGAPDVTRQGDVSGVAAADG